MNNSWKRLLFLLLTLLLLVSCTPAVPPAAPTPAQVVAGDAEKWDLTEYFADDAAAISQIDAIRETELPAYAKLTETVENAHDLLRIMRARDELYQRIYHVYSYALQKTFLNAADATAKTLDNYSLQLEQEYALLDAALNNRLLAKETAFWDEVFSLEALSPYWRELQKMRDNAPHILTDEEEAWLMPASQAQNNLRSTHSVLSYANLPITYVTDPDGNEVRADYNNYSRAMGSVDREYRKRYYLALFGSYTAMRDTFAANLNAYATLSEQLSVKHNYASRLDESMQAEGLAPEMYDTLILAGRSGASVMQWEAEIQKESLGVDELYLYDLGIRPGETKARAYTYADAQAAIRDALAVLGEDYISIIDKAFSQRWVDVYPAEGKDNGAYSGMASDMHPWILLNFVGNHDSVSALAHELGHAVHHCFANESRESVYERGLMTLPTEVAAMSNELLLSRYLIDHAKDPSEKLYYIQYELALIKNSFFSQISFADFEREFHKHVENGEVLTADLLDSLYLKNMNTYFPGITHLQETSSYWASVPHFYQDYYVYSYAMAISVACVSTDAIYRGDQEMLQNYLKYLSAGNSADAPELIAMLGIDITDPAYTEPLIARFHELLEMEVALLEA